MKTYRLGRLAPVYRIAVVASVAGTLTVGTSALASSTPAAPQPTVKSMNPAHGLVGATINLGLSGFQSGQPATVTVGQSSPTDVTWQGTSHVTFTVPSDATSGKVTMTQGLATASAPSRFTLTLPTRRSAAVSTHSLQWPSSLTVTGSIRDSHGPVKDQWARLERRYPGSAWRMVSGTHAMKTDKAGTVQWTTRPTRLVGYRVLFGDSAAAAGGPSTSTGAVHVTPYLALQVPTQVPSGVKAKIKGTIRPAATGRVKLQDRSGGGWHTFSAPRIHHGRFKGRLKLQQIGSLQVRAVRNGGSQLRGAVSHIFTIHVVQGKLQEGDSGKEVRDLQKRLRQLHYDVGAVNGDFGFDTLHAVTAFQKIQGINDNGVVGRKTWQALASPKVPHLRYPMSGDAVEVNLADQVVLLEKNAKIWRIVDASTGGGYYFTDSNGNSERAVTPRGHFSVQYKVDHWVTSRLGTLYRPAYFTNTGYAIHGETDVPPYAASHGCVRITVPAMDRYYNFFYDGQSVWIYGQPPWATGRQL